MTQVSEYLSSVVSTSSSSTDRQSGIAFARRILLLDGSLAAGSSLAASFSARFLLDTLMYASSKADRTYLTIGHVVNQRSLLSSEALVCSLRVELSTASASPAVYTGGAAEQAFDEAWQRK